MDRLERKHVRDMVKSVLGNEYVTAMCNFLVSFSQGTFGTDYEAALKKVFLGG
jgi:hypothetical protein